MLLRVTSALLTFVLAVALIPLAPPAAQASPTLADPSPPPGGVILGPEIEVRARVVGAASGTPQVTVGGVDFDARVEDGEVVAAGQADPGVQEIVVRLDGAERTWQIGVSVMGVSRLAGENRYATAAAISRATFREDGSASVAVLARGNDFADGLAGAPLAVAAGGPLLLTDADELPAATRAELDRLLTDEDATVYILGGASAISPAVERAVAADYRRIVRLEGSDRAATAAAIAAEVDQLMADEEEHGVSDTEDNVAESEKDDEPALAEPLEHNESPPEEPVARRDAVLVAARVAADGLAVAGPAAAAGMPILLTQPDELPAATAEALEGRSRVLIVGGSAVVSEAVEAEVAAGGAQVRRLAGKNRFATAVAVGQHFDLFGGDVALASADGFADALAGGPHAAADGLPLLFANAQGLPAGESYLRGRVTVYGGAAMVGDATVAALHRQSVSRGAPPVRNAVPGHGSTVDVFPRIRMTLPQVIDPDASVVHATINGAELNGRLVQSDSGLSLSLVADEPDLRPGRTYTVEVTGALSTGDGTIRHHAWSFAYRTPLELNPGDSGEDVRRLQRALRDAGYWLPSVNGSYGPRTTEAVIAFQKSKGLPRTGRVDTTTWRRLMTDPAPPRPRSSSGTVLEIDTRRDVLMIVVSGQVRWVFHVSTGRGGGAVTTPGRHRIFRQVNGNDRGPLGVLYRPKYFHRGIAIHGYPSVPTHSASSGCVRIPNPAMDFLWSSGYAPIGRAVWVYRS